MTILSLSNVINVSVNQTGAGLGAYNPSNLAIFTTETKPGGWGGSQDYAIYLDAATVATDFGSNTNLAKMAELVFSQQPNILANGGYLMVWPLGSDDLDAAIPKAVAEVSFFGIMTDQLLVKADIDDAAAVIQALPSKMGFFVGKATADLTPSTGKLISLVENGYDKSRGLLYIGAAVDADSLAFQAAYAGRALSTVFSGSLTVQDMHLKDLVGVVADSAITQTILSGVAKDAGVDCYVNIQNVEKVFCSNANKFFDQVYNREAMVGDISVAGFNYLALSNTKVPQTEEGMDGLSGAYRKVCEQYIRNGYIAPGQWTSGSYFGNQEGFLRNISDRGYYIYHTPVALQSQADRAARKAPLIQIAVKEAGSIESSSVVVNINA